MLAYKRTPISTSAPAPGSSSFTLRLTTKPDIDLNMIEATEFLRHAPALSEPGVRFGRRLRLIRAPKVSRQQTRHSPSTSSSTLSRPWTRTGSFKPIRSRSAGFFIAFDCFLHVKNLISGRICGPRSGRPGTRTKNTIFIRLFA